MQAGIWVLRDLPGVRDLEERLQRIESFRNPLWAPERSGLDAHVEQVSERLFGITEEDTWFDRWAFDPDYEADEEEIRQAEREWMRHFAFLGTEAEGLIWDAMGWDVTNGAGEPLRCLEHLERQIVAVMKGLAGRKPGAPANDAEIEERAEEWGASLEEEAERFRKRRGR